MNFRDKISFSESIEFKIYRSFTLLLMIVSFILITGFNSIALANQQPPKIIIDRWPEHWSSKHGGLSRGVTHNINTGKKAYSGIVNGKFTGERQQYITVETFFRIYYSDYDKSSFHQYHALNQVPYTVGDEVIELRDGRTVPISRRRSTGTFGGLSAEIVEVNLKNPSYSYVEELRQGPIINWVSSHSYYARTIAIESGPGSKVAVITYLVEGYSDPASIGENPESELVEKLIREVEDFISSIKAELPTASTSIPPSVPSPIVEERPFAEKKQYDTIIDVKTLISIGILIGPENLIEALIGIIGPGLLAILIGLLGGPFPPNTKLPGSGPGPSEHILSDGRTYREGRKYTFNDGMEYVMQHGELRPVRSLAEGEIFVDPNGGRKIWKGGQSWYEEDWRRQDATNREYKQSHDADWTDESRRLNPDMVASQQQYELEKEAIHHFGRMQDAAVRHGMAVEGAVDDMYGRAGELLEQIRRGESPDYEKISRLRSYIGNRISGFTPGPSDYPPPEKSLWADGGAWAEALTETGRNLTQARNSDGSTSWRGLAGRIGLGLITGGTSEWVFVPMASTYTMKDAVDSGASGLGAAWQGIKTAIVQDMIGRGIGIGISGATGAWQGGTAGAWQGLRSAAADQARQFSDLFSRKAWQATGHKLANSISNGSQRFANIISGNEGYTGPSLQQMKEGAHKGVDRILGRQPKLSATEQAKLKQFNDAVNSGDPNKVAELYKDGGMKELSELQRKGVISPESARKCNSILKTQVDESIREGTRNSIIDVQNQTQVRVKEVIVADSGSSAKSQVTRLNTDADRTLIPTFNESDLMKYANRNNLTRAEAYNDLCRKLNEAHTSNVGQSLKGKGLTAKDVDFGSYDRIGSASGQTDSYPTSFTNARTGVDGTAEVTRVSADGNKIYKPYKTSGQAAADANQLNVNNYGTGRFDADPTKILPGDTKPVLQQQIDSIFGKGKTGNPEALAKSVERFHKQASIGQHSTTDGLPDQVANASKNTVNKASERMIKTSRLIRDTGTDPGSIEQIVRQNGYSSLDEFNKESAEWLRCAANEFGIEIR